MDNTNGSQLLQTMTAQGPDWGRPQEKSDAPPRTLIEFVSADPTGPLSLHQARNGVVGDALAKLLIVARRASFVHREFYVNDAASALRAIARSLWNAARNENGLDTPPPAPALMTALGENPHAAHYLRAPFEEAAPFLQSLVADFWLQNHQQTLQNLGVSFDEFYKESSLHASPQVSDLLADLQARRMASDEYGALWLRSSRIDGEERDYVLRRADGSFTYLAADLAYHKSKFDRGYDQLIDVWNRDHAAYVGRTRAGLTALGLEAARLNVVLCDGVRLIQDGAETKNTDSAVLEELYASFGKSAVRLWLLSAPENEPLTLDTALMGRKGTDQPFYFAANARLAKGQPAAGENGGTGAVLERLAQYPGVVEKAADALSPFILLNYALTLGREWYEAEQNGQRSAGDAVRQTMENIWWCLGR